MLNRTALASVLSCAMLSAGPAQAASDTVLPPSSPWVMNYDGDRCVLSREFGEGALRSSLQFIRYEPANAFELVIAGATFSTSSSLSTVRLRFGEAGPLSGTDAILGKLGGVPTILTVASLDNAVRANGDEARRSIVTPAQEAAATTLHVVIGLRRWVFGLGPMNKPMAALRSCESALLKNWGLDPEEQATLSAQPEPIGSPAGWITSSDYPAKALDNGRQALIRFRLMVDAEGVATHCKVQSNIARDPAFAEATCKMLMQRARFKPARSATGQPVPGYYTNRVRWIL